MVQDAEVDIDLVAKNKCAEIVSLKKILCHEAAEMLGLWLAPNGDNSKQIQVLKKSRTRLGWKYEIRIFLQK